MEHKHEEKYSNEPQNSIKKEYISVILATHRKRMKCFCKDLFRYFDDKIFNNYDLDIIKNGSLLLLTINNTNLILSSIDINNDIDNREIIYTDISNNQFINNSNNQFYKIYIIIHGEAEHEQRFSDSLSSFRSLKAQIHLQRDTSLTPLNGVNQVREIAQYFAKQILDEKIDFKIDYLFSSNLKRTIQTLDYFMHDIYEAIKKYLNSDELKLYTNNSNFEPFRIATRVVINSTLSYPSKDIMKKKLLNITSIKEIIILPCSHDLYYRNTGNCDAYSEKLPTLRENIMNCKYNEIAIINCNNTDNCCKTQEIGILLDWNYYKNQGSCKTINMIQEIINIITQKQAKNSPSIHIKDNFQEYQSYPVNIHIKDTSQQNQLNETKIKKELTPESYEETELFGNTGGNYHKKYLKYKYKYLQLKNKLIK